MGEGRQKKINWRENDTADKAARLKWDLLSRGNEFDSRTFAESFSKYYIVWEKVSFKYCEIQLKVLSNSFKILRNKTCWSERHKILNVKHYSLAY